MTEMYKTDFANISDLNRGNARKVIEKVKDNTSVYIMKNNVPEAVMVSVDVFNEIRELLLYKIVAERVAEYEANPKDVITQEELDKELGISEADLEGWENVELEDMDGNLF